MRNYAGLFCVLLVCPCPATGRQAAACCAKPLSRGLKWRMSCTTRPAPSNATERLGAVQPWFSRCCYCSVYCCCQRLDIMMPSLALSCPCSPWMMFVSWGLRMESLNMMPVEVVFRPSGKYWIGSCPSLNVSTQGETFERAQENLKEALALFIESCLSRGTLEEVLSRAGYSKVQIRTVSDAAGRLKLHNFRPTVFPGAYPVREEQHQSHQCV